MPKNKSKVGYFFFRFILGWFKIMPFGMIYGISNFLYYVLYYLVGYRKKVVRQNLENSFPNKSTKEIVKIEKKFYRHLADIFVEGVKGMTLSDKEVIKRWKIITPDAPIHAYNAGKPSIFVGAHYNNWEWGALATGLQVVPPVIVFYKPISNQLIDQYVREKRMDKGVYFAPINETFQTFETKNPERPMYNMIADQSPSNPQKAHWVQFLNQDTPVLHGPPAYAKKYDLPIWFIYINKVKRGHYEISAELMVEDPHSMSDQEISELFMSKVEKQILTAPEYWLWSHKRWKHVRSVEH